MKKHFTKKELEIMKTLWNSEQPLIASDIVKQNESLNINTVQACLRSLIGKKAIKIADIVHSGTVLTRSYVPIISREKYLDHTYIDILGNNQTVPLIKCLIDAETQLEELEELEKAITKKKLELQGEK